MRTCLRYLLSCRRKRRGFFHSVLMGGSIAEIAAAVVGAVDSATEAAAEGRGVTAAGAGAVA